MAIDREITFLFLDAEGRTHVAQNENLAGDSR